MHYLTVLTKYFSFYLAYFHESKLLAQSHAARDAQTTKEHANQTEATRQRLQADAETASFELPEVKAPFVRVLGLGP